MAEPKSASLWANSVSGGTGHYTSPQKNQLGTSHHKKHITKHYVASINSRLNQDKILMSRKKYGKNALPEHLVLSTWTGTLNDKSSHPENWLQTNGVLVGIPF